MHILCNSRKWCFNELRTPSATFSSRCSIPSNTRTPNPICIHSLWTEKNRVLIFLPGQSDGKFQKGNWGIVSNALEVCCHNYCTIHLLHHCGVLLARVIFILQHNVITIDYLLFFCCMNSSAEAKNLWNHGSSQTYEATVYQFIPSTSWISSIQIFSAHKQFPVLHADIPVALKSSAYISDCKGWFETTNQEVGYFLLTTAGKCFLPSTLWCL